MSAIISSLDKSAALNFGENGHVQHAWDYKTLSQEKVSQFYFQLVRSKDHSDLKEMLNSFLRKTVDKSKESLFWRSTLYKMFMNTRDVYGKGEYSLSLMMILCWYNTSHTTLMVDSTYKEPWKKMIEQLVYLETNKGEKVHPLGCWKDLKYLCNYVREETHDKNHPIIMYCLELYKNQYENDMKNFEENKNEFTLFGKWMPREKSKKFGWIFKKYVRTIHMNTNELYKTSYEKAAKNFRQNLSKLNKKLETTEIFMCSSDGGYSKINYNRVPTQCMRKNMKAFNNKDKKNQPRSEKDDRVRGAENFQKHMEEVRLNKGNAKVHGKRCHPYELVKNAIMYNYRARNDGEDLAIKTTINAQWEDNSNDTFNVKNIIPMVDTSGSMECDEGLPLYNSIALGIRIAQKNSEAFSNRILTFESEPRWIHLDETDDFVDTVKKVRDIPWGGSTNFQRALEMILDAIVRNNIPPDAVEKMVLAIFSDMQFDYNIASGWDTQYQSIKNQFSEAGLQSVYKKPYNVPHILFWNLRKTNGFPCLSNEQNVTMLSGYNSTLINVFCNKGFDELKNTTSFQQIMEILNNERYSDNLQQNW
jgi:hypothetical protein|uniref:TROVE domain-containing protein n=1 Tax=viral metagenome TaxID=1070528 RepID=A0A6C0ALV8_9ZZZZ